MDRHGKLIKHGAAENSSVLPTGCLAAWRVNFSFQRTAKVELLFFDDVMLTFQAMIR
jgi:hypothetical protein